MNLKAIDAALAAYQTQLDDADLARLAFFRALWGVQDEVARELAPASDAALPDAERLRAWARAGEPALSHMPAAIDAGALAAAIGRVAACLSEHGGFPEPVCEVLASTKWGRIVAASPLELAGSDPAAYVERFAEVLADDGASERGAEVGAQAASLALRALLEAPAAVVARTLADADAEELHSVRCPVCGCEAAVARVGSAQASQGRGKELWCAQCGCTWGFERVRCARCGTQNQGHLHYFNLEGDEAHRIATCDQCGGYVRTVYQDDALAPFSFEVEDVVMAKLDLLAYQRAAAEARAEAGE